MSLELVVELELTGLTERYSMAGLSPESNYYEPRVQSFGDVSRELPIVPGGEFQASDSSVLLKNGDNHFSILRETHAFKNRRIRFLMGDTRRGEADFTSIFEGTITDWKIVGDLFKIDARNTGMDKLDQIPVCLGRIAEDLFPDLPGTTRTQGLPFIMGRPSTVIRDNFHGGAVPAFLIDPAIAQAKFRYLLAAPPISHTDLSFFQYDSDTPFGGTATVSDVNYAGIDCTVVDFDADMRDPDRPNEYEVSFNSLRGIVDAFDQAFDDPVSQLYETLIRRGFVADDFDATIVNAAKTFLNSHPHFAVFGATVTMDEKVTLRALARQYAENFNLFLFQTKGGKLAIDYANYDTTPEVQLTFSNELLRSSIRIGGSKQPMASAARISFGKNWVTGELMRFVDISDSDEETRIGESIPIAVDLPLVNVFQPAYVIVSDRMFFVQERRQIVSVDCAPELYRELELGQNVGITHPAGPASDGGGYVERVFRVIGMNLKAAGEGLAMTLRLVDLEGIGDFDPVSP